MFYSLILFTLIFLLRIYNISSLSQNLASINPLPQVSIFITLLSFGGLPPFRGFTPKWIVVRELLTSPVVLSVLVMSSLLTLFFYLRIGIARLLQKSPSIFTSFFKTSNTLVISYSFTLNLLGIFMIPTLFIL